MTSRCWILLRLLLAVHCIAGLVEPAVAAGPLRPQISAGGSHSLALDVNGSLRAWGSDYSGQLGTGRILQSATPIPVAAIGPFRKIAAGPYHNLALRTDGSLWVWGSNGSGQLGDGTYVFLRRSPALVINDTVTGILDLDPTVLNNIPAGAVPRVILEARRLGAIVSLTLGANVYFGAIDLGAMAAGRFSAGGPYKVYVAAVVPAGITGVPAGIYLLDANRNWSYYGGGPLREYASNAALDQTQHYFVSILEATNLSGLIGTQILVGYGTDDQEMIAAQRYREIYTVQ